MQGNSPQRHKVHGVNSEIVTTYFNKIFVKFALLVSSLCVLCVSVVNLHAQDFKTIHDGVEYAEVNRKLGDDPVKINLLRLDLTKVRLDVHHAMDAAIGTEKTSSIATRHRAVAAINAGFFRLDKSKFAGDAAGVLKIDGKLFSESTRNWTALGLINKKTETEVGIVGLTLQRMLTINGKIFFCGTNREIKDDEIVEFTQAFGPTTLTKANALDIIVRKNRIAEIVDSKGNSPIPKKGLVISATGKMRSALLEKAMVGRKIEMSRSITLDDMRPAALFDRAEDIVGGRGRLVKDGINALDDDGATKSFVETRHPRTAVAKLKDGKFLMITVDGRQPGVSVGMNLNELAEYLLGLGAVDAMNFDGGGSTTMFLDGKVVNKPSDKEGERKVSDAIIVTLRKKK
jgi:exopolysaccharide biosynthesis protein